LTTNDFQLEGRYHGCKIDLLLKPLDGLSAKFCWLNARFCASGGVSTKGQQFSIVSWIEYKVSFLVEQKFSSSGDHSSER